MLIELVRVLSQTANLTPTQQEESDLIATKIESWPPCGQASQRRDESWRRPDPEQLWQLVWDVERLIVKVADDDWVKRRLEQEADPHSAAHGSNSELRWSAVFKGEEATFWLDKVSDPDHLETARLRLLELTDIRASAARQHRANELVRVERLLFTAILAASAAVFLAVSFALAIRWQGRSASGLGYVLVRSAVALLAGGLGGALARALRLRDAPLGTLETGRFRRGFWAQMALGGGFGVVAMVLVEVGGLPRLGNGSDAAMVAVYAFLVGWSEPFLLNVLRQLAPDEGPTPTAQPPSNSGSTGSGSS